MGTPTFIEDQRAGGGRYAAIFHIAGMPWACTTDAEILSQLDNPTGDADARAIRRLLFGSQNVVSGTDATTMPSDHVQIIPSLSANLGSQSCTYNEGKGLTGGPWGVEFGREAAGATYDYVRTNAVPGIYDGLDITPDPNYSGGYVQGRLSSIFTGTGCDLTWIDDSGLAAKIVADIADHDVSYLYIGSMCIVVREAATESGGEYTVDGAKVYGNIFRSPSEHVFPSEEGVGVYIFGQPTLGIEGLPANLWLLRLDNDGTISGMDGSGTLANYLKPILFRTGPVTLNSQGDAGTWEINCKHWLSWMDVNIPTGKSEGTLTGYRLTHEPSTVSPSIQAPHLSFYEYNGAAWAHKNIWLCAQGSQITFETLDDLLDAVVDQLNSPTGAWGSQATVGTYQVNLNGIVKIGGVQAFAPTYIDGPVAWILNLGTPSVDYFGTYQDRLKKGVPPWDVNESVQMTHAEMLNMSRWVYDATNISPPDIAHMLGDTYKNANGQLDYYYQYNFNSATTAQYAGTPNPYLGVSLSEGWPIPYDTINTSYQINLTPDTDATMFSDDEEVQFGVGIPSGKSTVASTGVNYILTDTGAGYTWDSIPVLVDTQVPSQPISLRWPGALFHLKTSHVHDPWKVSQPNTASSSSLSDMFLGLLGDDTNGESIPERVRLWWVPDAFEEGDFRELIDWDRLASLSDGLYPSSTIALPTSGNHNVWKMFVASLLSYGIRPTWGYSEAQRAYRMSFEPFGVVSSVDALMHGRKYDSDTITATVPRDKRGGTWLYKDVDAKCNYDENGENPISVKFSVDTARAAAVGGSNKLKIDDHMLQLEESDLDIYTVNLSNILAHTTIVPQNVEMTVSASTLASTEVGSSVALTSNTIWNTYAGSRGADDLAAMVTKSTTKWSNDEISNTGKLEQGVTLRISPYAASGWSPSMAVPANGETIYQALPPASVVLTLTNLETDSSLETEFVDPNDGFTQLATFGCFIFNDATDTLELRDCDCTDGYAVRIFDRNATSYDTTGAGTQNVWSGILKGSATDQLTVANVNAGTCRIILEDATDYDIATEKIVIFMPRTTAALQPCQKVWGWLGESDGRCTDSDGNSVPAMSCV